MAGGIDWFRWHHGSVTDPKFQLVARKSGASLPDVLAVWAYVLEQASAAVERGAFGEIDCEAVDCMFGFPSAEQRTEAILMAMQARGLIGEGRIVSWEKRQPKREREDDRSTQRVQAFRERQRSETPGNATERQETPRGEERREEVGIPSLLAQAPASLPSSGPQLALVEAAKAKARTLPDCPHQAILALWAEVLPAMPQHNPGMWNGTRADHLRARWRETAASKGWESESEGLAYLRKLFCYIGQSQFLTGRAKTNGAKPPFIAELSWVINAQNWAKIHEGKYHSEAA